MFNIDDRESFAQMIESLIAPSMSPQERYDIEEMARLVRTDDAYYRFQHAAMKRRIAAGEYDAFKVGTFSKH